MSSTAPTLGAPRVPLTRRLSGWLDALPHPPLGMEISEGHVAAVRWPQHAVEPLPGGVVVPSPVELNIVDTSVVGDAVRKVLNRIQGRGPDVALLLPDQVVRVFLLHFETFPRRSEDAIPLLRWRLKKSVPFDVEDTVVSYLTQPGPPGSVGVEVLTAVARQRVVRQYEEVVEAAGVLPGVVMSSSLATLAYFEDDRATLMARLTGGTLTTVIVRGQSLCVYRCAEIAEGAEMAPKALLDEIYPAVAYYQDTWKENVATVCLAGGWQRYDEFRQAVEAELGVGVTRLTPSAVLDEPVSGVARTTVDRYLDALVGWTRNRGA